MYIQLITTGMLKDCKMFLSFNVFSFLVLSVFIFIPLSKETSSYSHYVFASIPLFVFESSKKPTFNPTLGKLCLQNEDLAKQCIAALARELETSNDAAIRNNVTVVMCDLCVRWV